METQGRIQDLRLSRRGRRFTAGLTAGVISVVGMSMIVVADYNNWAGAWSLAALFALAIYTLGTPAFRIKYKSPGKIELNSMLGLLKADLSKGYTVKRGLFGKSVVVLRAPKKRYRINGGLGDVAKIEGFLQGCAGPGAKTLQMPPS